MKIALVHQPIGTISPSALGGSIDIWIYEVARRLARSYDVIVYAKKGRNQKKVEYNQGVHYRRISAPADELFAYLSIPADRLLAHAKRPLFAFKLYYLTYAFKVAEELRAQKCDIVHLQNFSQFIPIIRAFNRKIKIVLHMHCEWLTQLERAMIERRLREVDLVIGCSEYITGKIRRCFPQFAKRCQTIYDGVDVNNFVGEKGSDVEEKKGVKRLLFVGRVSPEKGLHVLLDAFQKVVDHYPQVHLKIVGPLMRSALSLARAYEFIIAVSDDPKISGLAPFYHGSYFSHLKGKISLDMASRVSFTGFTPYAHLVNHYRDADILVNPSFSEAFGMSLIEAMACQVPVVATRVGGVTEIVENGKTGILVEPGDASALAEAILRLLSDEDLRKSMGKAARLRVVELFSWEQIVENLLRQYKNICPDND